MLGLDDRIAAFSDGGSVWIILAVAILLGLRHATDPDHIAAVSTLVANGRDRAARRAGELGLAWGLGTPSRSSRSGCRSCFSTATCPSASSREPRRL